MENIKSAKVTTAQKATLIRLVAMGRLTVNPRAPKASRVHGNMLLSLCRAGLAVAFTDESQSSAIHITEAGLAAAGVEAKPAPLAPGQKVVALVNVIQVKAGSTYTVSSVNTVYYGADESPSPFSLFLVNERGAFVGCCYPHQVRAAEGV